MGKDNDAKSQFRHCLFSKILVPHWERGNIESVFWKDQNGVVEEINCSALGGSVGTNGVLEGQVIEIKNWSELEEYGENIKRKIVFFNRAMNPTYISTGMAYGNCVDQRHNDASKAVEYGAIAVLVRSMTLKF